MIHIGRADQEVHEGNAVVRIGKWKLVRIYPSDRELYDTESERTEYGPIALGHPDAM